MKIFAIEELIPQRAPIVLVDTFSGLCDNVSYTSLTIRDENIFCQDGYMHESGVIEHIAQSAAARVGYIYKCRGELFPLGYIGSIDKMKIHSLPLVGSELYTQIKIEQEVGDITLISACVKTGETIIAEGRMKIFLKA